MNAQPAFGNRSAARKQRGGYSLMELMIVVAITGILAAVAIPSFSSYIQKSRTSEAVEFLGVIKLRQEAYRAEFGTYYVCGGVNLPANIAFVPYGAGTMKNAHKEVFPTSNTCFAAIGARPGGDVRFGYGWAAGLPSQASSLPSGTGGYGLTTNDYDHYFIAQAVTDLDGDGTVCTYELTSFTRQVWYSPDSGWE
jgi:prepilin-type N-terminal cleavage/methylation domain-containing protein